PPLSPSRTGSTSCGGGRRRACSNGPFDRVSSSLSPMEQLWQDVRLALRTLIKTPSITVVIILTIGLGVGANAAMFSVLNSFMLRPLAVKDPASLVVLANVHQGNERPHSISYADYLDYRGSSAF